MFNISRPIWLLISVQCDPTRYNWDTSPKWTGSQFPKIQIIRVCICIYIYLFTYIKKTNSSMLRINSSKAYPRPCSRLTRTRHIQHTLHQKQKVKTPKPQKTAKLCPVQKGEPSAHH